MADTKVIFSHPRSQGLILPGGGKIRDPGNEVDFHCPCIFMFNYIWVLGIIQWEFNI